MTAASWDNREEATPLLVRAAANTVSMGHAPAVPTGTLRVHPVYTSLYAKGVGLVLWPAGGGTTVVAAPRVKPTARPTIRATAPRAKHMVAAQDKERDCLTGSRPASPTPSAKHSGWHTSSTGSSGWRTVRALAARTRWGAVWLGDPPEGSSVQTAPSPGAGALSLAK